MVKVNGWEEMPEGILGASDEEAETVINASRGEAEASVCTTDAVWYRRMLSLCKRDPACRAVGYEICGGQPQVGHFMVPKGFVKVQPKPARRPLSEEQRAALRARLAKANAAKAAKAGKYAPGAICACPPRGGFFGAGGGREILNTLGRGAQKKGAREF